MAAGRVYAKLLRQNAILCIAGDGRIARKPHPVEFLGQKVPFAPGAVKLARLVGAPLLPMFWAPAVDQSPALEIDPPIIPSAASDEDAVVMDSLKRFANGLAARIMRWPEAYRNWHLVGGDAGLLSAFVAE
jgi:lauroyl/myristoyl acyltransferase